MPVVKKLVNFTFNHMQVFEKNVNFLYEAQGVCQSPYKASLSLQTKCSFPNYMKPSGCIMYNFLLEVIIQKCKFHMHIWNFPSTMCCKVITYLIMFHLIIGAKVFKKFNPSLCSQPLVTNLALNLKGFPLESFKTL